VGRDTAVIFYFTHPGFDGVELAEATPLAARRTAVHAARLTVAEGGVLTANREFPAISSRFLPPD
jgi:hypothetical protein